MIDKTPIGFLDPDLVDWVPEGGIEGLYSKSLARCGSTGSYTRLLKLLPGTNTESAGIQAHDHLEEILILEGAIEDLTLGQTFAAGMYANRLARMEHGPWHSPGGAVTIEVRDYDPEESLTKEELEFFDHSLLPWDTDESAGIAVKNLTSCQVTGSYGRLIKYQPGAGGSADLRGDLERSDIWIVSGILADRRDERAYGAGTYGNVVIDLLDGSWTSPYGCVIFEVRNRI